MRTVEITATVVDDIMGEHHTLQSAIKRQAELRAKLDEIEEVTKLMNKEYDRLRTGIVPEKMDEEGLTTITIKGIGRVSLTGDVYASIPAEVRDDAWDWLRDHGHADVIKETINASTLKALMKSFIKEGVPFPEDLFKVTPFTRASITKA